MELIILIIIAVVIVFILGLVIIKLNRISGSKPGLSMETELALANQELQNRIEKIRQLDEQLQALNGEYSGLKISQQQLITDKLTLSSECARLSTENENLKQAYAGLESLLAEFKQSLAKEFMTIKTQALLELQNKANETLAYVGKNSVVDPLSEKLRELDTRIIELRKETHDVSIKSSGLSEQANNLTQALIRDSQKKGEFGEMILANILEFAGLKERVQFIEQTHVNTQETGNKNLRADCVIHLPDGRGLIIDSKNIVGEYYNAIANDEDRNKAIRNAVLANMKLFADKDYVGEIKRVSGRNLFDYMIMFIPNEGLFNLIVEMDAKLDERGLIWQAYSQKVIVAGPSTILAILAIIDKMWQSHQVEEKSAEIIKAANQMVDQLRLTLSRMTTLGNSINKVAQNYNEMVTSFANGSSGSMAGKFAMLTNYKREIDTSQPVLPDPVIRRLPDAEL